MHRTTFVDFDIFNRIASLQKLLLHDLDLLVEGKKCKTLISLKRLVQA